MTLFFDLLYLFGLALLAPWLLVRALRTGRYRRDLRAKLFGPKEFIADSSRPLAWFHGVSVGEIHLLVTVVAAFRKRHSDWYVAVSSTTDSGLAEARDRFPDCTVIPYPFDFSWACRAAFVALRPSIVVLAESELWPNFLAVAAERTVPVVVVNARISPRSFARLNRVKSLARRFLLNRITAFAAQSGETNERLGSLGVPTDLRVVTGSVKYDGASSEYDTPKSRALREWLPFPADSIVWVAGSTHAPEESIVIAVFQKLHSRFPQLRLILVPRHRDRFDEVGKLLEQSGVDFARRSQATNPGDLPIILLDTIGELGAVWSRADFGYTGGSLDGHRGGQSMIEPAGYGVPTVFGPHIWNFRDAALRLVDAGGATMIRSAEDLLSVIEGWILKPETRMKMGRAARELVAAQQGATERTMDLIDGVLNRESSRKK